MKIPSNNMILASAPASAPAAANSQISLLQIKAALDEKNGSAILWMASKNPKDRIELWNKSARDLVSALSSLNGSVKPEERNLIKARAYFWLARLLKYLPDQDAQKVNQILLKQVNGLSGAKEQSYSIKILYEKARNAFAEIFKQISKLQNINVQILAVERALVFKELGEYFLDYSSYTGTSYIMEARANLTIARQLLAPLKDKGAKEKSLYAETLVLLADARIELYKKEGAGNEQEIEALLSEAKQIISPNTSEKLSFVSAKLELLKLKNKINEAAANLEKARKGCTHPDAKALKEAGKFALESTKASLLNILGSKNNPQVKSRAAYLLGEALSKQDYDEEKAIKEAYSLHLKMQSKGFNGSIAILGKPYTEIGKVDYTGNSEVFTSSEIIKIKYLMLDNSPQKLKDARDAAINIILFSSDKFARDDAFRLYCLISFRQNQNVNSFNEEQFFKDITDNSQSLDQILNSNNVSYQYAGRSWQFDPSDPLFKTAKEIIGIYNKIKKSDLASAQKEALAVLTRGNDGKEDPVDPFIKKEALFLYCEALVKEGTPESRSKAAKIYAALDSTSFDGNIAINEKTKIVCVDKVDEKRDIHIKGPASILILEDLIKQEKFKEAAAKAAEILNSNLGQPIKDNAQDLLRQIAPKITSENKAVETVDIKVKGEPITEIEALDSLDNSHEAEDSSANKKLTKIQLLLINEGNLDEADKIAQELLNQNLDPNIKKQAFAYLGDILLRKSTPDSVKQADEIFEKCIEASRKEEKTFSYKTFLNIAALDLEAEKKKLPDSPIWANAHLAQIKNLFYQKNYDAAQSKAVEFLDLIEKENPYDDYIKTLAIISYLEALLGGTSPHARENAEAIINSWKSAEFKGTLTIKGRQYTHIPALKKSEEAGLYRAIGISFFSVSNFEDASLAFKKAENADPSDPSNPIFTARALYLAQGLLRSDREFQEKYEKALGIICDTLPPDALAILNHKIGKSKLENIFDIIITKDLNSKELEPLTKNPNGRLLILTALEYNSKLALLRKNDIDAETFAVNVETFYDKWINDEISIPKEGIFRTQRYYDLAGIYRYQGRYYEARKKYEKIKEIDGSNWWLDRQIYALKDHSFLINPSLSNTISLGDNLSMNFNNSFPLSSEFSYRTYAPMGIGPVSNSSISASITPLSNISSEDGIKFNGGSGSLVLSSFTDTAKTQNLIASANISTDAALQNVSGSAGLNFIHPLFVNTFFLNSGVAYLSNGPDQVVKVGISPELRFPGVNVGVAGAANFHQPGEYKVTTYDLSLYTNYLRNAGNIFGHNVVLIAEAQAGLAQELKTSSSFKDTFSKGVPSEIKKWIWRDISNYTISFTKSNFDPDQEGDPKSFYAKYYWTSDAISQGGVNKKLWHVSSAITSNYKEKDVSAPNSGEKIKIYLKNMQLLELVTPEDGRAFGPFNTIETDDNAKPTDAEISEKINVYKCAEAKKKPPIDIYQESAEAALENDDTVVIVYGQSKSKEASSWKAKEKLYRIRTAHIVKPDGQVKVEQYFLDIGKHGEIAIPASKEKLPQEELIFGGESEETKTPAVRDRLLEKAALGLEMETPHGTFGGKIFGEANQLFGGSFLDGSIDSTALSYGLSLYGRDIPFIKLSYGSLYPSLTVRKSDYSSKEDKSKTNDKSDIDVNLSLGYRISF